LRFGGVAHVKIQKLLPVGKIIAGDGVGVFGVKIVPGTGRDNGLRLKGPWTGKFIRLGALDLFVAVFEVHDQEAISAINLCGVVGMGRVHDDEGFVKSADDFEVRDGQRTFELPLSRAEVVIEANGLGVSRRIMKENHPPAVNGFIPDNARISADARALFVFLPFENEPPASPRMRNSEGVGWFRFFFWLFLGDCQEN
jgi:hypothetical protein